MTDYLIPLDATALRTHDIPDPWAYGIRDRVRFHELDALGHVNNNAYLKWFEDLRVSYLADHKVSSLGPGQAQIVLMSQAVRYHAPMFLGEDYIVTGRTTSFRTNSFRMEYGVFRAGHLIASGEAVMVSLTPDGSVKHPLPKTATTLFIERDGATREG